MLGLRYLSENDATWIAEIYRNGTGYPEDQLDDFLRLADSTSPAPFNKARQISPAYARANAGRDYLYLRATWLHGDAFSEFGEKQNKRRLELLARFYF